MRLTEEQQRRITQFLRHVNRELDDLSGAERRETLERAKDRIVEALRRLPRRDIHDTDVIRALKSCGTPEELAARVRERPRQPPAKFLATRDRTWLGVCGGIARLVHNETRMVRIIFVLLGLVTGPVALILYLAVYSAMYLAEETEAVVPIDRGRLVKALSGSFGIALALFAGTEAVLWSVPNTYARFTGQGHFALDSSWGWLDVHGPSLFLLVLALVLPIAAMSGLPVPDSWASTLRKVVQAVLALYALGLCFGMACVLVGTILYAVEQATGTDLLQALFSSV